MDMISINQILKGSSLLMMKKSNISLANSIPTQKQDLHMQILLIPQSLITTTMQEKHLLNCCNRRQSILSKFFVFSIDFSKVQILKEDSNFNPTELFNQIDQFGKGYITHRTLKKCTNLSNDYISAFFRFLDKDNDGRIFESEFLSAFKTSQKQQQLAVQYKDLRQSQEKEKQIIQQCQQIQQNLQMNEEKNSQQRIKQVQQLLQSRQNLDRSKGQNSYSSLLKVRQQLLQIDYIRRNSQRETFERLLKYQHQLIKNIKEKNEETTQKQKNLSSLHDQLYTMRTQQDLSLKRKREYSIHSQSQL
ncbi:unnamed protein product [Paramecium primaurelia]|uniref:EF-hand domain-containing protein n=1 Tax=Paramecium primaurelia TaxID=5886 RepID=A0A8S1MKQ7_PARPR|nr:unnamed protein product [Paramecium primaurelia]